MRLESRCPLDGYAEAGAPNLVANTLYDDAGPQTSVTPAPPWRGRLDGLLGGRDHSIWTSSQKPIQ
jgi:hypothetical protein